MPDDTRHPLTSRPAGDIIARRNGAAVPVAEFLGQATALAARLPDRPYVINLCGDRYEFLVGFCAAVIAGQCTLMPPNRQVQTILDVASNYEGNYVLGRDRVEGLDLFAPDPLMAGEAVTKAPLIADDQFCAIVFTSGSTGKSKPNRKYWRTLRAGTASNASLVLDTGHAPLNVVATVPAQHMWGFEMSILLPLFANIAVSGLTPFFPQDIFEALRALPRPRALVSSPVHLGAFLDANTDAVRIDRIYTATAPMPVGVAKRLEQRFSATVVDVFGCSESGIIAARRLTEEEDWRLAGAFTLEGTKSGTLILADHLDEQVPLADRVELLDGQRFRWIGRDEDMINIAGKRGSLADLNQRLNVLPGVKDGVIFTPQADAKRLAALVVAPSLKPSDILAGLREAVEPAFLPRPVYLVSALPRQETGKLPRRAILELFEKLRQDRRAANDDDDIQAPGD
jgi:acyl-coenzyme A synthetase/AMP-(fatty) acid ligase